VCVQPVYLLLVSVIISITRPSSTIYLRLVMTLIFGEAKKRNGLKMYCCLSPTSTSRRHSCKSLAWLWTTTRVKKRKGKPTPENGNPGQKHLFTILGEEYYTEAIRFWRELARNRGKTLLWLMMVKSHLYIEREGRGRLGSTKGMTGRSPTTAFASDH